MSFSDTFFQLCYYLLFYHIEVDFFLIIWREVLMFHSHDPPSTESGRDKRYYEHDSGGKKTSQHRDNRMNAPTFKLFLARKLQHFQSP
jgi:hypothetical protein